MAEKDRLYMKFMDYEDGKDTHKGIWNNLYNDAQREFGSWDNFMKYVEQRNSEEKSLDCEQYSNQNMINFEGSENFSNINFIEPQEDYINLQPGNAYFNEEEPLFEIKEKKNLEGKLGFNKDKVIKILEETNPKLMNIKVNRSKLYKVIGDLDKEGYFSSVGQRIGALKNIDTSELLNIYNKSVGHLLKGKDNIWENFK